MRQSIPYVLVGATVLAWSGFSVVVTSGWFAGVGTGYE